MRLVLDTNVLLSAAFFLGVCEKLLAHCFMTPSIQLVLSEHILGEFVEHGLGKLNGTADQIDAAVAELRRRCQIVPPRQFPPTPSVTPTTCRFSVPPLPAKPIA